MFRVKICGITSIADAQVAAAAGADAVGLNFYRESPRFINVGLAGEISRALPESVTKVGVFVNATAAEILDIWERAGLDLVQLHGDEPPELIATLRKESGGDVPVMRAFRCSGSLAPVADYLSRCAALGSPPQMLLIDAFCKDRYGGSGELADWKLIADGRQSLHRLPDVLAGGLTPNNVSAAIASVAPVGVDTASGVEISPGRKSPELVRAFVHAAQRAYEILSAECQR